MARRSLKPYFLIGLALLLVLCLPASISSCLRRGVMNTTTFVAQGPKALVGFVTRGILGGKQELLERVQYLELENKRLCDLLKREKNLTLEKGIMADVVYRDPSSWQGSLWINVGSKTSSIVQKNSPVMSGTHLIGVIDDVTTTSSRVRLITDALLHPSVRVLRGKASNEDLLERMDGLKNMLEVRDEKMAVEALDSVSQKLQQEGASLYLAKGELHGASHPLWRAIPNRLQGIGFNLDRADNKGPSRDLRTGLVWDDLDSLRLPLVEPGDLLVTTGMDGIFPADLKVAYVESVEPLEEGGLLF